MLRTTTQDHLMVSNGVNEACVPNYNYNVHSLGFHQGGPQIYFKTQRVVAFSVAFLQILWFEIYCICI